MFWYSNSWTKNIKFHKSIKCPLRGGGFEMHRGSTFDNRVLHEICKKRSIQRETWLCRKKYVNHLEFVWYIYYCLTDKKMLNVLRSGYFCTWNSKYEKTWHNFSIFSSSQATACNFIKKETSTQVFLRCFLRKFEGHRFYRHLRGSSPYIHIFSSCTRTCWLDKILYSWLHYPVILLLWRFGKQQHRGILLIVCNSTKKDLWSCYQVQYPGVIR